MHHRGFKMLNCRINVERVLFGTDVKIVYVLFLFPHMKKFSRTVTDIPKLICLGRLDWI